MTDAIEKKAKEQLAVELMHLEDALDVFLGGEIKDGLITPFKMVLINHSKCLLALAGHSRAEVRKHKIRVG